MASLTDQVNQELEVSQLIGQHEVHPPSLLARGWCWCPCPSWCAGSLHRSSLLSLKKDENRVKTNFRTKKSWTYSRPSSAGRTWAWSPCRGGRLGRAGGGWRGGGTTLPAAQKASSEPHFKPHQCTPASIKIGVSEKVLHTSRKFSVKRKWPRYSSCYFSVYIPSYIITEVILIVVFSFDTAWPNDDFSWRPHKRVQFTTSSRFNPSLAANVSD